MAKQPKGFGQPVKSNPKKSNPKKSSPKTPPKPVSLSLAPLKDMEFVEEKEVRLTQIFAVAPSIPFVSPQSLQQYHQHLQSNLPADLLLMSEEPFAWEDPFIYGRGTSQEHQAQRHQHPSYFDRFQFITLSPDLPIISGIQIKVQRLEEGQIFTLPLIQFNVARASDFEGSVIADYRFWWHNYQPVFP